MGDATAGTSSGLMTIDDLAARWEVTTSKAWEIVRECKVPYLCLGGKKANLAGKGPRAVKFRAASIERWEEQQEGTWEDPAVPAPIPAAAGRKKAATRPASAWDEIGLGDPGRKGR